MPAANARGLAVSGSVLSLTGLALATLRYLIPAEDAFSAYPHPWWKYVVMVHVLATPVFFFFLGSVWWRHVVRHWKSRERRASGAILVTATAVVAVSGYLLYFVGSRLGVDVSRFVHTAGGVAVTVLYVYHAVTGIRASTRVRGMR
jgi:hypothetical protein